MQIRYKHNKKRNTAILYEMIVREFTVASLRDNNRKINVLKRIIKEYFSKGTILGEELQLYKLLYETKNVSEEVAREILSRVKSKHNKYSFEHLYKIQKQLMEDTKVALGEDIFSHFIPNYRILASISQIFSDKVDIESKIALEQKILENMTLLDDNKTQNLEPLDSLSFKRAVGKFNAKYSNTLSESQKTLLQYCVFSEIDDGVSLKNFINKEITRITPIIEKLGVAEKDNDSILESINNIKNKIANFSRKNLDEDAISFVLKLQRIADEAVTNVNH